MEPHQPIKISIAPEGSQRGAARPSTRKARSTSATSTRVVKTTTFALFSDGHSEVNATTDSPYLNQSRRFVARGLSPEPVGPTWASLLHGIQRGEVSRSRVSLSWVVLRFDVQ